MFNTILCSHPEYILFIISFFNLNITRGKVSFSYLSCDVSLCLLFPNDIIIPFGKFCLYDNF